MSGNLPSGVTDADIDRAAQADELPCDWEKFSGVCMVCGSGPDGECVVENERARAAKRIVETVASMRAPTMEEVATLIRQWGDLHSPKYRQRVVHSARYSRPRSAINLSDLLPAASGVDIRQTTNTPEGEGGEAPCEWSDTFVDDHGEISDVCVVCGAGVCGSCKYD